MTRDPLEALDRELLAERVAALARIAARFDAALEAWKVTSGLSPPRPR